MTNTTDTTDTTDTTSTTGAAPTVDDLIDGYLRCWNTLDDTERAAAVAATWHPEATIVDPLVEATGHADLTALFTGFHEQYPEHSFRRTGGFDAHHRLVRWGWEMLGPDGTVVLDGLDCALLADDGRLWYVAGFFGAGLPA